MILTTHKLNFKICRHFAIGFEIYSPRLNGVCFDINIACFTFNFWSKGKHLISFQNYWNG